MDQSDRDLLRETLRVAQDNNRLLRQMRFWGRVAFVAKVIIWTGVLLLPVLLYSRFAPLFNILPGSSSVHTGTTTSLFGFPSPFELTAAGHPH
jgi:hypothetical protein